MVSFASDLKKQTGETDPSEDWLPYKRQLQQQANAAAKPYAAVYGEAVASKASPMEEVAAKRAYESGDYASRQKAATQNYDVARSADIRSGTLSDRVRAALFNRQDVQSQLEQKQYELGKGNSQQTRGLYQNAEQTLGKQDFSAFQNAADRLDKMTSAYNKGLLEMQMLDATRTNKLELADLDRYYSLALNDLQNQLRAIQEMAAVDQEEAISKITNKARNISTVIEGIFETGGIFATDYLTEKYGTSGGSTK